MTGTEHGMGSRAALFLMELAFRGNEIPNSLLLTPSLGFRVNGTQHGLGQHNSREQAPLH